MSTSRLRWLTGKDVFVSYSRRDGADYALKLASDLAGEGYACVIDQWGTQPGGKTPRSLQRDLMNCHALVLVSTRGAGESAHVFDEVRDYARTHGLIIPIDIDGTIDQATWAKAIEGLPIAKEPIQADGMPSREPSAAVLGRVRNALTFRRRDQRLRIASLAALALLLGLLGASGVAAVLLNGQRAAAQELQSKLEDRGRQLASLEQQAGESEAAAKAARRSAADAETQAKTERTRALAASSAARLAAAQATAATKLADRESERASLATAEADRQLAIADARQRLGRAAEVVVTDVSRDHWSTPRRDALDEARASSRDLMARMPELTEADETYIRSILNRSFEVEQTSISGIDEAWGSADGARILVQKDNEFEVRDAASNRTIVRHPEGEAVPWTRSDDFPALTYTDNDGVVFVTVNGQPVRIKSKPGKRATPMAIDNGGRALAFWQDTDDGGRAFLQRLDGREEVIPLCNVSYLTSRFSPDGAWLAVQCEKGLELWNVASGKMQSPLDPSGLHTTDVQFSRDSRRIAAANGRTVTIWPVDNPAAAIGPYSVAGKGDDVESIGFDATGDRIGVYIEKANPFCINVLDGRELHSMIASWEYGERGKFEPIGQSGTFSSRKEPNRRGFTLYDACTGDQVARIPTGPGGGEATFNEKRGELLVVNGEGNLFRIDLTPAGLYARTTLPGEAAAFAAADAPVQLVRNRQSAQVWDLEHGRVLHTLSLAGGELVDLSGDGDTLVAQSGDDLSIWRCLRGGPCEGWRHKSLPRVLPPQGGADLTVEDNYLLITQPGGARLFYLGEDEPIEAPLPDRSAVSLMPGAARRPTRLLIRSGEDLLYADLLGAKPGPARPLAPGVDILDSSNGVLLIPAPASDQSSPDVDPDGRRPHTLVNAVADTPKAVIVDLRVHDNRLLMVASENGQFAAFTQDADQSTPEKEGPTTVEIVDLQTGAIVHELQLPTQVHTMRFDGQGRLAVSAREVVGGESGFRLQIFDPDGWEKVFDALTTAPASCLAFGAPDGTVVAGQTDGQISVFDRAGRRTLHTQSRGTLAYCELFDAGRRLSSIAYGPQGTVMEVAPGSREALAHRLLNLTLAVP
jgi:hypothetical protein